MKFQYSVWNPNNFKMPNGSKRYRQTIVKDTVKAYLILKCLKSEGMTTQSIVVKDTVKACQGHQEVSQLYQATNVNHIVYCNYSA